MDIKNTIFVNQAFASAQRKAESYRHEFIMPEHLLSAIIEQEPFIHTLQDTFYNYVELSISLENYLTEEVDTVPDNVEYELGLSVQLSSLLQHAYTVTEYSSAEELDVPHLIQGLLQLEDSWACHFLKEAVGGDLPEFLSLLITHYEEAELAEEAGGTPSPDEQEKTEPWRNYVTCLNDHLADHNPLIGREMELERTIQVLCRKENNNPLHVGEPGVGKTALAYGLAARIEAGNVPERLAGFRIYELDLGSLLAGTQYRGDFEKRLKSIMEGIGREGNAIVYIDEIHNLIGAGRTGEGSMDASNMLKPYLETGAIRFIGSTTYDEYNRYFARSKGLVRRFQQIDILEPNIEEAIHIVEGLKEKYEAHHKVVIEEQALESAVQLSERYITDRNLPDKAIDVLDEACSKVSLKGYEVPENLKQLEQAVKELASQKEESIERGDFAEASLIQKEQDAVQKKLDSVKKRFEKKQAKANPPVTVDVVAEVVSAWTKVPVSKLAESDAQRLKNLEHVLQKRVIGQDEAVGAVARAVKRGRVGLKDPKRPIGSFLFLGPTGVGKTELSKALAEALFGKEDAMIRVDMSEYMEKHSVSKMIGSPPGYVGHEEGGQLSDQVRTHPYSVILFDEIEKAHPDVFNVLLQVLDDGHITDSQGRKVDFSNTVIIMTSNAGAKAIVEPKKLGFATTEDPASDYKKMKQNVMDEVKQIFRPEFLNRIDEIIVFHSLGKEEMKKIVSLLCNQFTKRLESQMNIYLKLRESAKAHIVEKGTDAKYGARPLRRALQTELEDKLADAILNGEIQEGDHVAAGASKKGIHFVKTES